MKSYYILAILPLFSLSRTNAMHLEKSTKQTTSEDLPAACMHGNIKFVKQAVIEGANIEEPDELGKRPLHIAAENNHVSIAKLLLHWKATIEAQDLHHCTPLHLAVVAGNEEMVLLLLDCDEIPPRLRAHIEAQNEEKATPLILAVKHSFIGIVNILLRSGANKNAKDADGHDAYFYAKQKTNQALIKLLNKKQVHWSPLHVAVERECLKTVELLLSEGAEYIKTKAGLTPLHIAAQTKNSAIAKLLVAQKAVDVDEQTSHSHKTPLHIAVYYGQNNLVETFLDHGANPLAVTKNLETPLHIALGAKLGVKWGYFVEISRYGAPRSSFNPHIFRMLLKRGGYTKGRDYDGNTPLHLAVKNIRDRQHASFAIRQLLLRGASLAARNLNYDCPLLVAVKKRGIVGMKGEPFLILLEQDAPFEIRDSKGDTPLHIATRYRFKTYVKMLVSKGANRESKNAKGESALSIANSLNDKSMLILLQQNNMPNKPVRKIPDLVKAVETKGLNFIQKLVEKNTYTPAELKKACFTALQLKRQNIAGFLVSKGALTIDDTPCASGNETTDTQASILSSVC